MKVVILAGGYGTRISEESEYRPKPMIEIGGMPILWHIMKEYSYYGFHEFVICAGYKQKMIKEWFANYLLYNNDVTFDLRNRNQMIVHNQECEPWIVTIADTGLDTPTGARVKKIQSYVGDETFMLTYGDGVCDVNIKDLLSFHQEHGKTLTITAVKKLQEKGVLEIMNDLTVKAFREKSVVDSALINAGYMVVEPKIFEYLNDHSSLENDVLPTLVKNGELKSYVHEGYWQCMDTIREKMELEALLERNQAPWIKW
ncbi:MAG: glucose-1-phosphate cytidylyltransferase [Solobacterium sp.]|nr:glucose-1-phosphate cytidylyltransferase [Solobacterium sp.]